MGSPRIKGSTLSLLVDGVDHWADVTSCVLDGRDLEMDGWDSSRFAVRMESWFDIEAIQSTDPSSFWTFLFEHRAQHLPFGYAPHGNEVPTEAEPHFTGILITPDAPPRLGGQAGRRTTQTFTTRLYVVSGPLRVTEP